MSDLEFAGVLYPTYDQMVEDIVANYMAAGGMNGPETIAGFLETETDEQVVSDLIEGWEIEEDFISRDDLMHAMKEYRKKFPYENVKVNGTWRRYETVVHYMDDDIREELSRCADIFWHPQMFTDEYCHRHKEEFGEEFDIN